MKTRKRKFTGQNQLTLWLGPQVYAEAGEFTDNENCPIATAIKQQLSGVDVDRLTVFPTHVNINHIAYNIPSASMYEYGAGCSAFVKKVRQHDLTVPVILQKAGRKFKVPRRKFTYPKRVVLWLHPDLYDKAGSYSDIHNCPIATAIKEQYTGLDLPHCHVGGDGFSINGVRYQPPGDGFKSTLSPLFVDNAREHNLTVPVIGYRV